MSHLLLLHPQILLKAFLRRHLRRHTLRHPYARCFQCRHSRVYDGSENSCRRSGFQASNVLSGMAAATGLAILDDGDGVDAGDPVRVILL